jgi:hypothetical protein
MVRYFTTTDGVCKEVAEPVKPVEEPKKPMYKCVQVTYNAYKILRVPIEWDAKDIGMVWDEVYYKDERVAVEMISPDGQYKHPDKIEESDCDVEDWFDCENSGSEDE